MSKVVIKDGRKKCTQCKKWKILLPKFFYSDYRSTNGFKTWCKKCEDRIKRERKHGRRYLLKQYGLTISQHTVLLDSQNGVCAGCNSLDRSGRSLAVDHDHITGRVRGLLCMNCNNLLGRAHDDPSILRRLADYLERGII